MKSPACARILVLLALASAAPALAFDFIVTEYTDDALDLDPGCTVDHCTLREAVIAANAGVDLDRILLSAGVYALTIVGTNENLAANGDLDVERDCEIVGVGAGITILDATGSGEQAITASEGGLDFTLRGVTVRNSDTVGISLGVGVHTIEECEIRDNGSTSGHHGIFTSIGSVTTLRRVTVAGNSGNGLNATQSSTTIENSTFSANGAHEVTLNLAVAFSCTHCTIHDPADSESEIDLHNSSGTFANSIVDGGCEFDSSSLSSTGGNVESPGNTCSFGQGTDLPGTTSIELDLAVLADNGGPTRTHLPGLGSAPDGNAVDALCIPLGNDQRGVVRETNCESGSVERTGAHVETPIFNDGFLQGDTEAWSATIPPP